MWAPSSPRPLCHSHERRSRPPSTLLPSKRGIDLSHYLRGGKPQPAGEQAAPPGHAAQTPHERPEPTRWASAPRFQRHVGPGPGTHGNAADPSPPFLPCEFRPPKDASGTTACHSTGGTICHQGLRWLEWQRGLPRTARFPVPRPHTAGPPRATHALMRPRKRCPWPRAGGSAPEHTPAARSLHSLAWRPCPSGRPELCGRRGRPDPQRNTRSHVQAGHTIIKQSGSTSCKTPRIPRGAPQKAARRP